MGEGEGLQHFANLMQMSYNSQVPLINPLAFMCEVRLNSRIVS